MTVSGARSALRADLCESGGAVPTLGLQARVDCGELVDDQALRAALGRIAGEVAAVAASEGITVSSTAESILSIYRGKYGTRPSMLQDIEGNRALETDAIVRQPFRTSTSFWTILHFLAQLPALCVCTPRPPRARTLTCPGLPRAHARRLLIDACLHPMLPPPILTLFYFLGTTMCSRSKSFCLWSRAPASRSRVGTGTTVTRCSGFGSLPREK